MTTDLHNEKIAVVGLGRTGLAAVRFLRGAGAEVAVTDDAPLAEIEPAVEEARRHGASWHPPQRREDLWREASLCVTSPGVPWHAPVLEEARAHGLEVVSELEIASRSARGTLLAVTGTNGKSTTTELLAAMLRASGRRALEGGNLGRPLSELLEEDGEDAWHVLECSSFQLQGCTTFRPRVAVYLNFSPNHLDVHRDLEEYRCAKARIFAQQDPSDVAVHNAADAEATRAAEAGRAERIAFHVGGRPPGGTPALWAGEESLWRDLEGEKRAWMPREEVPLAGTHNLQNVLGAAAAALAVGCDDERIREAVRAYRALPHRLTVVARAGGVTFVDDSKATNPEAVRAALEAAPGSVRLLLGGRDKGGAWASLSEAVGRRATGVYVFGEAAALLERTLGAAAPVRRHESLEEAVEAAWSDARDEEWILLSPGCSSFDSFASYAERGDTFAAAARRLAAGLEED